MDRDFLADSIGELVARGRKAADVTR